MAKIEGSKLLGKFWRCCDSSKDMLCFGSRVLMTSPTDEGSETVLISGCSTDPEFIARLFLSPVKGAGARSGCFGSVNSIQDMDIIKLFYDIIYNIDYCLLFFIQWRDVCTRHILYLVYVMLSGSIGWGFHEVD